MNNNTLLIVKAVCAILVGVLLIASPGTYTLLMVRIIGGVILVAGLVPVAGFWFPSPSSVGRPPLPVFGVGTILLGIMLILVPQVFVRALMYVLALLFLMCGVQQFVGQVSARGSRPLRWWPLFLSVALVALGIFVLANPMQSASVPFFLLGVGSIVYGGNELRRVLGHISSHRGDDQEGEYVDYEEVTDDDTMRR